MKEDEIWHYDSYRRRRYQFCGDCDYKNPLRSGLVAHVNRTHPFSKTALPPPLKKGCIHKTVQLHCSHRCDYQTTSKIQMDLHERHHTKKSTYECIFCTYSVKTAEYLRFHLKRDHPESLVGGVPSVSELSFIATKEKVEYSGSSKNNHHRPLRSYSVSDQQDLNYHLNHDHDERRSYGNSSNDTSIDIITVCF